MSPPTQRKFVILDQSLMSYQGHDFEYAFSLAEAVHRLGWVPIIVANEAFSMARRVGDAQLIPLCKTSLYPAQSGWFLTTARELIPPLTRQRIKRFLRVEQRMEDPTDGSPRHRKKGGDFLLDLQNAIAVTGAGPADMVFLLSVSQRVLEGVTNYLLSTDPQSLPGFRVLILSDVDDAFMVNYDRDDIRVCLQKIFASGLYPRIVRFFSDTAQLSSRYSALSPVRFRTVPIPFRHNWMSPEKAGEISDQSVQHRPLNVIYLGQARVEKGFQHLPRLVESLWDTHVRPGKLRFTFQANMNIPGGEPGIREAHLDLRRFSKNMVRLFTEPLNSADYYRHLLDGDIVVLPYDADTYRNRSSAPLAEALLAGKPVVVPAGTWMAEQIDDARGRVFESAQQLAPAVAEIADEFARFRTAAHEFARKWRHWNSPDVLAAILTSDEGQTSDCAQPSAAAMTRSSSPDNG